MRTTPVKSAARVLDLLELLALVEGGLKLSEISHRMALPKSSASALLATLLDRGYIELTDGRYRLARRFSDGDWVGTDQATLLRVARPVMAQLAEATGETAFLGVMVAGWNVQYVAKAVSPQTLRYDADLGAIRPAYSTTIGLSILSGQTDEQIETYLTTQQFRPITEKTIIDVGLIRKAIHQVRQHGFVRLADTNVLGTSGIGAPIHGRGGDTIAGLSIIAPSSRLASASLDKQVNATVEAVVSAAETVSRALAAFFNGKGR